MLSSEMYRASLAGEMSRRDAGAALLLKLKYALLSDPMSSSAGKARAKAQGRGEL